MTHRTPNRRLTLRPLIWSLVAAVVSILVPAAAAAQNQADDPALLELGEEVFSESCAGCHGVDGAGSNTGRPLTGVAGQEPDRTVHVASVTNGKGGMPALGEDLSADQIDAAVTYVRLTFVSDRDMDELPNTGATPVFLLVAAALIVGGLGLNEMARRGSVVIR